MGYKLGRNQKAELKRHLLSGELPETQEDLLKVADSDIDSLNDNLSALGNLGYELDGKSASKLFLVRQDQDGTFHRMSLEEAGVKPNSREFWKEAQMGSLFAYPSGSREPVQIQAGKEKGKKPEVSYSKPADPTRIVSGRVSKPNFFKRLMNRVNKNWFKAECEHWNNQERSTAKLRETLNREIAARTEETLEQELKETAAAERKAELNRMVKNAENRVDRAKLSLQYSEAIFEPEPKIFETPETKKRFPGRTVKDELHDKLFHRENGGKVSFGFMTAEHYNNLTQLGKDQLDLDAIPLGESGRTVNKSEFCSLAMFTAMSNDIVLNTHKPGPCVCDGYDPSAIPGLLEAGYSKEEAENIVGSVGASMYTTDTFKHPPRDLSGSFIKETIDVARRRTADALNAYKKGDLAPLGALLANGVNKQADNVALEENGFATEFAGGCESSRKLIGLMNADPRLKDAALKAGMEQKNLEVIEGLGKLCELDEKACQANLKLAKAERDGVKLSAEEKQSLSRDIVTAELAVELMKTENMNQKCPETDKMQSLAGPMLSGDQLKDYDYMKNNRPKGKFWGYTAYSLAEVMKGIYRKRPESIVSIQSPTGLDNLQKTAAEIVAKEKLAELEPGEIVQKMGLEKSAYSSGLAEKGLRIMKEKGMLEPKVTETIRKELNAHATEKMKPEAQKKAEKQQPEAQKKAEKQQPEAQPQAAAMGV